MSDTILDPAATVAAAVATGFRRRRVPAAPEDDEAQATAVPADPTAPILAQIDHPPPPLPTAPPSEAFTAALLASRLAPRPPVVPDHRQDEWAPPGSDLHLTDKQA